MSPNAGRPLTEFAYDRIRRHSNRQAAQRQMNAYRPSQKY